MLKRNSIPNPNQLALPMSFGSGTVYIYTLSDPRNSKIHYVGQTAKPSYRFTQHNSQADHGLSFSRKTAWIKKLHALSLNPVMNIIEVTTRDIADDREMFWIKRLYNNGYKLLNKETEWM